MSDVRFKLSPPWIEYARQMEALFDGDPQIAFNEKLGGKEPSIVLACNNGDKVAALQRILPSFVEFGNVLLNVVIDGKPSNKAFKSKKELFDTAFNGNPAYAYSVCPEEEGYYWFAVTYVVFKCCVVQYFCDNLNDCHGIKSTLYQDIAEKLLTGEDVNGVYFNTDVEVGKLGKPLDEWL